MTKKLLRRNFLKTSAGLAVMGTLPRQSRAALVNGKLRTAHVGVGGMGSADLDQIASHPQVEVAAVCDVDAGRLQGGAGRHPNAKKFRDYREMISKLGDTIDAVVVSTPDHTHAPASLMALNAGKPVYCQKPLTHEVSEAREMRTLSEAKGLPTQMGIQVHSAPAYRRAVKMIQDGAIGKVSHVYAWSAKNWGYDGGAFNRVDPVPTSLDWNLWLGTASMRPYHASVYHPGNWRKLIDFGTGTLGDMGVHIFDTPYDALALTAPNWAETTCRPPTGVGHPERNIVQYEFPGTDFTTDTLIWTWYDGADAPPKDLDLPAGLNLPGQGSLFIGEEGTLLLPHVGEARLFPEERFKDYQRPEVPNNNHYHQWVNACLGEGKTSADFSYAGPLTEALLLGVVANRFPGQRLEWDAENLKVTNVPEANPLITHNYRETL